MRRYGPSKEEFMAHVAPIVAAGLCTGGMGNGAAQLIADKAVLIAELMAKKMGMPSEEELHAEREKGHFTATAGAGGGGGGGTGAGSGSANSGSSGAGSSGK